MRINTILLLTVCIALAGGTAFADQMLIKYRSGNVQSLRLDEPSSMIMSITYQEESASAIETPAHLPTKTGVRDTVAKPADPGQKSTATPQTSGTSGVRIEWAPPVE